MKYKSLAPVLAIAVLSLGIPLFSIPQAYAFHDNIQYAMEMVQTYYDPLFGFVQAARDGSTVALKVAIDAGDFEGQQYVAVGIKFDWMPSWQNASNANPGSPLVVTRNQYVTISISISVPSLSGASADYNIYAHGWEARVWTGPANFSNSTVHSSLVQAFAIYSSVQAEGMASREEANQKITTLQGALATSVLITEPQPGRTKALADISQAQSEIGIGDDSYRNHDFTAANNHYRNALNLVNSASSALSGSGLPSYSNALFTGIGWLLMGAGVVMAGFGAFWYLLRRSKMKTPQ